MGSAKIGIDGTMLAHLALRRAPDAANGVWLSFERQRDSMLQRVLSWGDSVTVTVVCDGGRPVNKLAATTRQAQRAEAQEQLNKLEDQLDDLRADIEERRVRERDSTEEGG